jgi:hypothetical protein
MARTVEQNVDTTRKIAVFFFVCALIGIGVGIVMLITHSIASADAAADARQQESLDLIGKYGDKYHELLLRNREATEEIRSGGDPNKLKYIQFEDEVFTTGVTHTPWSPPGIPTPVLQKHGRLLACHDNCSIPASLR